MTPEVILGRGVSAWGRTSRSVSPSRCHFRRPCSLQIHHCVTLYSSGSESVSHEPLLGTRTGPFPLKESGLVMVAQQHLSDCGFGHLRCSYLSGCVCHVSLWKGLGGLQSPQWASAMLRIAPIGDWCPSDGCSQGWFQQTRKRNRKHFLHEASVIPRWCSHCWFCVPIAGPPC